MTPQDWLNIAAIAVWCHRYRQGAGRSPRERLSAARGRWRMIAPRYLRSTPATWAKGCIANVDCRRAPPMPNGDGT